ncbi:MAG: pimeloyl-ACP methyl ester carboxylesterase [Reinekea sp.]
MATSKENLYKGEFELWRTLMSLIFKLISGLFLLLAIFVVVLFIVFRVPDRPLAELVEKWAPPPSQFVDVAGMQIHLRDEGPRDDATPIVLLHGTSASLHTWDGWTESLIEERRVIRFDMAGFGLTGPSADNDYSIEHYASTVIAVLDHLNVDQVVLAGNSLGGNIAWVTALLYPQRIDALILVDSSGLPFEAKSVPIGFKIASTPILNKLAEQILPRNLVESSVKNVFGDPNLVTTELVDRYFDLTTRAGSRQALAERARQTKLTLTDRITELTLPTLILWGGLDGLIPLDIGHQFQNKLSNSQLVVFDNLGHVPQEEGPEETVSEVKRFLRLL